MINKTIFGTLLFLMLSLHSSLSEAQNRFFYISKTSHPASEALTACADGYHFASVAEIVSFSSMIYNTELGKTLDDSGAGVPHGQSGWLRTSYSVHPNRPSCMGWTSNDPSYFGLTAVIFIGYDPGTPIEPFVLPDTQTCNLEFPVWCVSDSNFQNVSQQLIFCDGFES